MGPRITPPSTDPNPKSPPGWWLGAPPGANETAPVAKSHGNWGGRRIRTPPQHDGPSKAPGNANCFLRAAMECARKTRWSECSRGSGSIHWLGVGAMLVGVAGGVTATLSEGTKPAVEILMCRLQHLGGSEACGVDEGSTQESDHASWLFEPRDVATNGASQTESQSTRYAEAIFSRLTNEPGETMFAAGQEVALAQLAKPDGEKRVLNAANDDRRLRVIPGAANQTSTPSFLPGVGRAARAVAGAHPAVRIATTAADVAAVTTHFFGAEGSHMLPTPLEYNVIAGAAEVREREGRRSRSKGCRWQTPCGEGSGCRALDAVHRRALRVDGAGDSRRHSNSG